MFHQKDDYGQEPDCQNHEITNKHVKHIAFGEYVKQENTRKSQQRDDVFANQKSGCGLDK